MTVAQSPSPTAVDAGPLTTSDQQPPAIVASHLSTRYGHLDELPVGASSAPPSTSVLFQVAGHSLHDVRRGRHLIVVNQFHPGGGGLISRFRSDRGERDLRCALREWAGALYPQAKVVEFIASCGVNDMQSACEGTFPRLR